MDQNEAYRPLASTVSSKEVRRIPKAKFLVIGRDLCSFVSIVQTGNADRVARRRQAELEALRISQAERLGRYIVSWPDSVGVWVWDEDAIDRELERAECEDLVGLSRVPEPLMLAPEMTGAGVRIIRCQNGQEAQVWRDGALISSRWWAHPPSSTDWKAFAAAASLPVDPPGVLAPLPLARPWRVNEHRPASSNDVLIDRLIQGAIVAGVAMVCGAATLAGATEWRRSSLEQRVAALSISVKPVREAQAKVRVSASRQAVLAKSLDGVDGLKLMNMVADALSKSGAFANSVEMREGQVTISLPADQVSKAEALLQALNAGKFFTEAKIATLSGQASELRVEAKLAAASP
jgi:hypothetical protein